MDMTGKTVVITGASRGIGADAARVFVAAGANVVLMARSNDAIADLTGELGNAALAIAVDVSRYWEIEKAMDAVVAHFGAIDVLINNAGVLGPLAPMMQANPEEWGHAIDINLKGVYHGMRAALPHMIHAQSGSILTVSSGAAHAPYPGWSSYCAGKAGAAMLTRQVHLEHAQDGIRAIGLSPGTVATNMQREIKASGIGPVAELNWEDHIPPQWPARALLWMCSPEADTYRGEEIRLRDEAIRKKVGLI